MRKFVLALMAVFLVSNMAYAADNLCESKAAEKKLAGQLKQLHQEM